MDRCTIRVRVRDAHGDNIKATKIKDNRKRKRKHMSSVYGDFHTPKSNLDLCTNPVSVPILCRVILDHL